MAGESARSGSTWVQGVRPAHALQHAWQFVKIAAMSASAVRAPYFVFGPPGPDWFPDYMLMNRRVPPAYLTRSPVICTTQNERPGLLLVLLEAIPMTASGVPVPVWDTEEVLQWTEAAHPNVPLDLPPGCPGRYELQPLPGHRVGSGDVHGPGDGGLLGELGPVWSPTVLPSATTLA